MASHRLIRCFIVMLLGTALMLPAASVSAQATPEASADSPFADLGLPQIDITVSPGAFEGVPSELEAGRYVVSVTDNTLEQEGAGGAFMQLPEGMTMLDFLEIAMPAATGGEQEASEASPMPDEGGDVPPPWYYETVIAGGPYAGPGGTSYAVVDLPAGEWVFWAEYPGAPQAPVPIMVTGEMPADLPTPAATVRIEMSEFYFDISEPVAAGPQIIELANVGEQPHFIGLDMVPEGTTEQDVLTTFEAAFAAFEAGEEASPAASPESGLSIDDFVPVFGTGDQSSGVTAWYAVDIQAGTYSAVCFVTDPETGLPHIMLGMIAILEVS